MLAHWNNSLRVDMSLRSNILSGFPADQFLVLLLKAACLAEKQQVPIFIVFCLTTSRLKPTISHIQGEQTNYYTTDVVTKLNTYVRITDKNHINVHNNIEKKSLQN